MKGWGLVSLWCGNSAGGGAYFENIVGVHFLGERSGERARGQTARGLKF